MWDKSAGRFHSVSWNFTPSVVRAAIEREIIGLTKCRKRSKMFSKLFTLIAEWLWPILKHLVVGVRLAGISVQLCH